VRVTIVGTGNMARGVAARALAGSHHVTFVGTDIGKAEDLADELTGLGPVRASETAEGDLVVLAVPYTQAPHAVRQHAGELGGAVIVDATNPIDLSVLEPLDVSPFRSGAEVIADVAPEGVPVVKAFNTAFAGTLVAGAVAGHPLDIFIAGDDGGRAGSSRGWSATAACGRSRPGRSRGPASSRRSATCTWRTSRRSGPTSHPP